MSSPAVTPGAPAASEKHSQFLPGDKKYRMTGEMPESHQDEQDSEQIAETEERTASSEKQEAPAASSEQDSSTAAASEAASTQERKGPAQTKTERSSESRWAKMSRENRELREQLARLNARTAEPEKRESKQESHPATEAKAGTEPQIDDVDAQGNPKYKTLADYMTAVRKYDREQSLKDWEERTTKAQREQQQAQTEQLIEKTVNDRVEKARKSYPDYDEVAAEALAAKDELGRDALFYTKGSHLDGFFLDSDRGHDVLYAIFKNFDDHKHIFARDGKGNYLMNPVRQLRELAKIENSLPDTSQASSRTSTLQRVSQAPRPPHQVSGKGTTAKDAVEQAVADGDAEAYIREQNARALARLKK